MRRSLRPAFIPLIAVVALLVLLVPGSALADPPPGAYFNGFETNTAGWFNNAGGTIHREASGYLGSGYAAGIASSDGSYHARLGLDSSPGTCPSGGGPQPVYDAPYTNWGGYSPIFPTPGYKTRVDIYLDVPWAQSHPDKRFDWSSAINTTAAPTTQHRRDFVFNVGTDALGFVISGSNNGNRCGAFPANPANLPIHITASGWYTFEHDFAGVPLSPLIVTMTVKNKLGAVLGSWTRSDPSDIIGVTVGGNRYGWFVQNEIDDLAIDNSERTGFVSTPGCEIKISDGGWITALNTDKASFGGSVKVSSSGVASGNEEYQDHGPVQDLNFKALTVAGVFCNANRDSAEIHGTGTVDGQGEFQYRITVHDDGEPGTGDTYGIFIPGVGYWSGDRTLDGGNIQIR